MSHKALKEELFEQFILSNSKEEFIQSLIPDSTEYLYFKVLHALNEKKQLDEDDLKALQKLRTPNPNQKNESYDTHSLDLQHLLKVLDSDSPQQQIENALNNLKNYFPLSYNAQKPDSSQLKNDQTMVDAEQSIKVDTKAHSKSIFDQSLISFEKHLNESYSNITNLTKIKNQYLHFLDPKRLLEESKQSSDRLQILEYFANQVTNKYAIKEIPQIYKEIYDEYQKQNEIFSSDIIHYNSLTLSQLQEIGKLLHDAIFDTLRYQSALLFKLFCSDFQQFYQKQNSELTQKQKKQKKESFVKVLKWMEQNLPVGQKPLIDIIIKQIIQLNLELEEYDKDMFLRFLQNPHSNVTILLEEIRNEEYSQYWEESDGGIYHLFSLQKLDDKEQTNIITKYITHFFEKADSIKPFDKYLDEQFLNKQFYISKIQSGKSEYITKSVNILSQKEINKLVESRQITILDINKKCIKGNEEVKLLVDLKNIQNLSINIFEMKTESYYIEKMDELDVKVNLDGLIPFYKTEYSYNDPPNQIIRREFNFELLQNAKRGVFIIDFFGNSISSRAVFQKGQLALVNILTMQGQLVTIIDEDKNICKQIGNEKTGMWFDGRFHDVNENGQILLPYYSECDSDKAILVHDGFSQLVDFYVNSESYSFNCQMIYNQETFIIGNKAKILFHPRFTLHSLPVSMKIIKDQSIKVKMMNHQGIPSQLEFRDFEFDSSKDVEIEIPISSILKSIEITVSGSYTKQDGKKESFNISKQIEFELHQEPTNQIYDVYLKKTEVLGYVICIIDKSGKPIENVPIQCKFKHEKIKSEDFYSDFETDQEGKVILGELRDIIQIECEVQEYRNFPEIYSQWVINNQIEDCMQDRFVILQGESIEIPVSSSVQLDRKHISFYSNQTVHYDTIILEDLFDRVHLEDQVLKINNLQYGIYYLQLEGRAEDIRIEVLKGSYWKHSPQYIVFEDYFTSTFKQSETLIRIKSIELLPQSQKESNILINLNLPQEMSENNRQNLKVHVMGYNFLSNTHQNQIKEIQSEGNYFYLEDVYLTPQQATFLNNKKVGDEICYVYNRQKEQKRIGNTLEKPCMLLKRTFNRDTQFQEEELNEGGNYGDATCEGEEDDEYGGGGGGGEDCCKRLRKKKRYIKKELDTFINFLKSPTFVSSNNSVREDGTALIKGFNQENYSCLQIIVTGNNLAISQIFPTKQLHTDNQDLRHQSQLKPDQLYTEHFSNGTLHNQKELQISADSQLAIISSIPELFESLKQAMLTGANTDTYYGMSFNIWSFLKEWPSLTDRQKLEKYNEYAGHQLNLFLYFKDNSFFKIVVEPFIKNKIQKTFIDHFLLNNINEIIKYETSERIEELNILEQSLLILALVKINQKERALILSQSIQQKQAIIKEDINLKKRLYLTIIESKKQENINAQYEDDRRKREEETIRLIRQLEEKKSESRSSMKEMCEEKKRKASPKRDASPQKSFSSKDQEMDILLEGFQGEAKFKEGYKKLEKTIEYKERQYYGSKYTDENSSLLITVNSFWTDLVKYIINTNGVQNFVSENYIFAFHNHVEALAVIALMDLSFSSTNNYDMKSLPGRKISISSLRSIIYFTKEIKSSSEVNKTNVNVIQTFYDPHDLYTTMKDDPTIQIEKSVEEFVINKIYGCKVIISNISIAKFDLSILTEIPEGAIPVNSFEYTKSIDLSISSYQTNNSIQFEFYFPQPGSYTIYRSNASKNGVVVAQAQQIPTIVVKQKHEIKKMESLSDILTNGTKDDILQFAKSQNIRDSTAFNINKILYFVQTDKNFFLKLIQIFKEQRIFNQTLWEYSFYHNYLQGVKELLSNSKFRKSYSNLQVQYLQTDHLNFDLFNVLEYHPLLTSRVHSFMNQNKSKILNLQFKQTYFDYTAYFAHIPKPDGNHYLVLCYYLILQERIDEAIKIFKKINQQDIQEKAKVQYDYFAAYLDIYQGGPNFKVAREICERYIEYPIISWRNLFINLINQFAEYDGELVDESEEVETATMSKNLKNAEKDEYVSLELEDKQIVVKYQNAGQAEINLYLVDIEVLFSTQPFMEGNERTEFTYIKPNETIKLTFKKTNSLEKQVISIPEKYANKNLYLQLISNNNVQNLRYFSSSLQVQLIESFGQVKVLDQQHNPLSKVYVKCYAKNKDSNIQFYRDGYTDLRGRLDYSQSSSSDVNEVEEFSILICSETHGSVIKRAKPPTKSGRMETTINLLAKKK